MVARLWPPRALRAGRHGHGRQWKHLRRSSRRRQTRWALRRHATEGKDRLAAGCPGRHAGFNLGRGGCNQGESRGGIWGPVTSKAKRDGAERGASWIGVSLTWDAICKVPRWKTLMLLPPPKGDPLHYPTALASAGSCQVATPQKNSTARAQIAGSCQSAQSCGSRSVDWSLEQPGGLNFPK